MNKKLMAIALSALVVASASANVNTKKAEKIENVIQRYEKFGPNMFANGIKANANAHIKFLQINKEAIVRSIKSLNQLKEQEMVTSKVSATAKNLAAANMEATKEIIKLAGQMIVVYSKLSLGALIALNNTIVTIPARVALNIVK